MGTTRWNGAQTETYRHEDQTPQTRGTGARCNAKRKADNGRGSGRDNYEATFEAQAGLAAQNEGAETGGGGDNDRRPLCYARGRFAQSVPVWTWLKPRLLGRNRWQSPLRQSHRQSSSSCPAGGCERRFENAKRMKDRPRSEPRSPRCLSLPGKGSCPNPSVSLASNSSNVPTCFHSGNKMSIGKFLLST